MDGEVFLDFSDFSTGAESAFATGAGFGDFDSNQTWDGFARVDQQSSFNSFVKLRAATTNDEGSLFNGINPLAHAAAVWRDEIIVSGTPVTENWIDVRLHFAVSGTMTATQYNTLRNTFSGVTFAAHINSAHEDVYSAADYVPALGGSSTAALALLTDELAGTLQEWEQSGNWSNIEFDGNSFAGVFYADHIYPTDSTEWPFEAVLGVSSSSIAGAATANVAVSLIDVTNLDGSALDFELSFASGRTLNAAILGDVNLDGTVDFLDITPFIAILSSSTFQAEADCDESGVVDFLDIAAFIAILSGS